MHEPHTAQPLPLDEIVGLVRDLYGLEVEVCRWPGEYDQNFQLTDSSGHVSVLKVMHPSRDASFVDLQCKVLEHLARRASALALPRVRMTRRGEAFTSIAAGGGDEHLVWLLSYVPGKVMADVRPHSVELLEGIGEFLGHVDQALHDFVHPATRRDMKWDSSRALWIQDHLDVITVPARRALVEHAIGLYVSEVVPRLPQLRRGVIYGDANDYNVLVQWPTDSLRPSAGLIDFGDMHEGLIVAEPAVAAAYALLGKDDPLAAATSIVTGFNRLYPLDETEASVLFPLIAMRLAVSVVNSALRKQSLPDDAYVTISEAPAWAALERLQHIHPRFATYVFRHACGFEPVQETAVLGEWFTAHRDEISSVTDVDLRTEPVHVLDLGVGSKLLGADPCNNEGSGRARTIGQALARVHGHVGIGRHDEARWVPDPARSVGRDNVSAVLRPVHLGMDIFIAAGASVHAPLGGIVHCVFASGAPGKDGVQLVLAHRFDGAPEFFTLYRHLAPGSVGALSVGQKISRGQVIGSVVAAREGGEQSPHLHFQLAMDLLDRSEDFPCMVASAARKVWTSLSPDPNLILRIPTERFPEAPLFRETLARRRAVLGPSLSVSYRKPLKVVRGWRQYLYDDAGRPYLDVFNNVPLVGHSHPRIVEAVTRQLGLLNTNTRYLHDNVVRYAERLTALLPPALCVCYFVNSGSEANELAIRMARTHTDAEDIVVLENAYHGNTGTVTDISPYKFNGPGGTGRKPWVHVAPIADDYRGHYRRGESALGIRYAQDVAEILDGVRSQDRRVAAFIAESMPSVGGQIVFPEGYLADVYRHVRAAGGVCIADEVQVGFGRLGSHFWGFETQHVTPDIVVLAKPIANCFPLAAVVTTREIATSFDNGMEFFSTYGGNPVSCAAGLAVLDVLEEEHLQANASLMGKYLLDGLRSLQRQHALIGDVRGFGLFLGVDLVLDRKTREPSPVQSGLIVNRLRERGVLAGTDGPFHNVLKLRPPLILTHADVDLFLSAFDSVLHEDLPPF